MGRSEELFIPVILWGKPAVISKGPDGCCASECDEDTLSEAINRWNTELVSLYREFKDVTIDRQSCFLATRRGDLVNIYFDAESLNSDFIWMELDLRSDMLKKRGPLGRLSAVSSPFTLEWNREGAVYFRFHGDELCAFVEGRRMSLEEFAASVSESGYYFENIQRFLK